MRILAAFGEGLAVCVDRDGLESTVMTALVGSVAPGDEVLVHAGVALVRLGAAAGV